MNTPGEVYPVLFTLSEVVSGNGFIAGVLIEGRGSMVHEDDGWWLYGVQPGMLAEDGDNPQEAHLKFAASFKEVLFGIASEAPDCDRFTGEVERMFSQVNGPEDARWNAALEALRAGVAKVEDPFLAALPKRSSPPFQVIVQRLDAPTTKPTPRFNQPNALALPKAA